MPTFQSTTGGNNTFSLSLGPIAPHQANSVAMVGLSLGASPLPGSWSDKFTSGFGIQNLPTRSPFSDTFAFNGPANPTGGNAPWPNSSGCMVVLATNGSLAAVNNNMGFSIGPGSPAGTYSNTFAPVAAGSTVFVLFQMMPEQNATGGGGGIITPNPAVTDSQGNTYFHVQSRNISGNMVSEADLWVAFNVAVGVGGSLTVHITTTGDIVFTYPGLSYTVTVTAGVLTNAVATQYNICKASGFFG